MSFLEAYIQLEKYCNDIYQTNYGISKYIDDLAIAPYETKSRIPSWESTYKKLKELRWKRNQYVHEGVIEFDDADTEWLTLFYQKIISGEDPLSQERKLEVEDARMRNLSAGRTDVNNNSEQVRNEDSSQGLVWGIVLIIIALLCGIMVISSLL